MSREEFLKQLKESLSMSLEKDAINAQLDYYDKYISDEIKNGKSEKEVLEELGDPRLIAKTIKTVSTNDSPAAKNESSNNNYNDNYRSGSQDTYGNRTNSRNYGGNRSYGGYVNNNGFVGCVIAGLVMFIIVYGILRFMGSIAYGVGELAFSGPIGFILVLGLFYLLFGRKK